MGKKSPNKRKSDGSSNSEKIPKKMKFGQPNTEKSPQQFVAANETPKSAQKCTPNATPKSAQKFNPGNKTPKSAQKLNVGNKNSQSRNKNQTPNSTKRNNQTPNSNNKKLDKFSGTAQLSDNDDESGDSNYEVEEIIKPEKIRKTMNQFKDSDEDSESSDDNDASQETVEDSSADKDVSHDDNDVSDDDNNASDDDNDVSDDDNDISNEEIENAKNENNENGNKAIKKKKNEQIAELHIPVEKIKKFVNDERKKKPARYVLFIGNLPYDTTVAEVTEHFNKSCKVKHVRLPKSKDNNKPRGFGYIDVEDEMSYLVSVDYSFFNNCFMEICTVKSFSSFLLEYYVDKKYEAQFCLPRKKKIAYIYGRIFNDCCNNH